MSLEMILGFGTKIQLNKRKTVRTISSPFPSPHTRVQALPAGFLTSVDLILKFNKQSLEGFPLWLQNVSSCAG